MRKHKISIITVTKNSEKFLNDCILSVKNQNYRNYEHIIVDGNSSDKTLKIIKFYKGKVKFFKNLNDKGLYDAMNLGIKKSSGSIIGILNSDDVYFKNTLKIVNTYFNKYENLDFLFGSVYKHKLLHGFNPKIINWSFGFYTTHSVGFFIKKKSQLKVGFYNLKYRYSADYDLFFRMIKKHKLKGMATKKNEIFGKFRLGGLSSRIRFIDYLKECNTIRIDNGQNLIIVYLLYILRIVKNIKKIIK
ncbi:MAG: hypothetical protein CBC25_00830 [Pelagibacteraceae bacterium TMED65]|nr:MAG: hypothetical protein CBC25_00830 [Pelagibacteraceae bacterium TMED65]|tara:strand:- start:468 stop:1205 length:738 start_codon:yes stop_codon:yes gene_type:complete